MNVNNQFHSFVYRIGLEFIPFYNFRNAHPIRCGNSCQRLPRLYIMGNTHHIFLLQGNLTRFFLNLLLTTRRLGSLLRYIISFIR